jgi:hypothetical protein
MPALTMLPFGKKSGALRDNFVPHSAKKGKRRCDTLPVLLPDAVEIVKVQGWSGIDRSVVRIESGRRTPGPFATGPASR